MLVQRDVEQKAIRTLCVYFELGSKIVDLISCEKYEEVDVLLQERQIMFENFKKFQNYLDTQGVDLFSNPDIQNKVYSIQKQNELIHANSSKIIGFYRSRINRLVDSVKYIKKAKFNTTYQNKLKREV